jgi:hypothetical protein
MPPCRIATSTYLILLIPFDFQANPFEGQNKRSRFSDSLKPITLRRIMAELTIGYVAGIIAATIFVGKSFSFDVKSLVAFAIVFEALLVKRF